jgi:hypothetical protein
MQEAEAAEQLPIQAEQMRARAANCPFYGRSQPFGRLVPQGNQCGLFTERFPPCILDLQNAAVEWRNCPLLNDRLIGMEDPEKSVQTSEITDRERVR